MSVFSKYVFYKKFYHIIASFQFRLPWDRKINWVLWNDFSFSFLGLMASCKHMLQDF